MATTKFYSRLAGVIGVLVLASGSYAHSVNSKLIDYGDASKTAANFVASESLFRLGFVSGLFMQTIFVLYAFLLYKLLRPAGKHYAGLMLILALIPVPLFLVNQLHQFAAFLLALEGEQEHLMLFLDLHRHGGLIVSIFFGLWLLPLGYLVFRSGYFPKLLGILLMIGCFGYLVNFIQGFLFPGSEGTLWTNPALIVTHISEMLLMFWLLIKGVNTSKTV